jgi:hypothetical protein
MKRIALAVVLALMIGCVGSSTPHNPMTRNSEAAWWQADTAAITSNNPWEIYVRPNPLLVDDDPWSSYEAPPLFPDGWEPAKVTPKHVEERRLRKQLRILKLRRKIRREKQLERRRLERLRKRSIINPHNERRSF